MATVTAPAPAPALPFPIASPYSIRRSFQIADTLGAASVKASPIIVAPVGFLSGLLLKIHHTGTDGGTPAWKADGPWNMIESINFRTATGANLIVPVNGYELYLMNKWGAQTVGVSPNTDPRFSVDITDPLDATFFLWIPLNIDLSEAYGVIPAASASAAYQIELTWAAINTYSTDVATAAVEVDASAHYFAIPPQQMPGGVTQAVTPEFPGWMIWQSANHPITPGEQDIEHNNRSHTVRSLVYILRTAAGARSDADWPDVCTLSVDTEDRFRMSKEEWRFMMSRWYGFDSVVNEVAGGQDDGVFVVPFHALLGSVAGDPSNTRAQLLPTAVQSYISLKGIPFGATASKLTILTQSISTENIAAIFAK